jgi:ribonuclease BN (tRNA processing enzyme)
MNVRDANYKSTRAAAALLAALATGGAMAADDPAAMSLAWTTLGTAGGPVANAQRSQPANLVSAGSHHWLVDCGDGAVERLAAAKRLAAQVDKVFISHLHMDHIGGLQGLIGLRWMTNAPGVLTVYGPPGTDRLVSGIVESMQPSARIAIALKGGKPHPRPQDVVNAVILRDGSDLTVDGVRVRAVRNSHFDERPGVPADVGTESLSYRFDAGAYAVGYTGDTGVSPHVARLFKGVGLVVSEVIDLEGTIANINGPHSPMPPETRPGLIAHLKSQHLTPQQAGELAAQAGAARLVLTHLAISGPTDAIAPALVAGARAAFSGEVRVAHDLDQF